jgi:hypothetical protein
MTAGSRRVGRLPAAAGGRQKSRAGAGGCGGVVLLVLEVLGASARDGPDLGREGRL